MNRKVIENITCFSRKEIRYLEDIGIIEKTNKNQGKEYDYSLDNMKRFMLVKFYKDCGYRINTIKDLLDNNDESEVIEKSISYMENQIKKLNQNIKLAKSMLNNDIVSFADYSSMMSSITTDYEKITNSYIFMSENFDFNNIEEQVINEDYFVSFSDIDDIISNDYYELDNMLNNYSSKNECIRKTTSIIEKISKVAGGYSHMFIMGLLIKVSELDSKISKGTFEFFSKIAEKYYYRHKEESWEFNLENMEKDLMNNLGMYSYDNKLIQTMIDKYLTYSEKFIKRGNSIEIILNNLNRPENIKVAMKEYNLTEKETKRRINEFIKGVDYYQKNN